MYTSYHYTTSGGGGGGYVHIIPLHHIRGGGGGGGVCSVSSKGKTLGIEYTGSQVVGRVRSRCGGLQLTALNQ